MSETVEILPEVRQIVGALLYAARHPLSIDQIKKILEKTAEQYGGMTADFAGVTKEQLSETIADFDRVLREQKLGMYLAEVAGGYRLENDTCCGPWLRQMLEKSKPSRLSTPALETLAVIAYRQPCTRSDIELVRGVAVDQVVRNLLELQLIKIVGRSDLPGRPWLFGTTQKFLEHFGLKDLGDLPSRDELGKFKKATEEAGKKADQPRQPEAEGHQGNHDT